MRDLSIAGLRGSRPAANLDEEECRCGRLSPLHQFNPRLGVGHAEGRTLQAARPGHRVGLQKPPPLPPKQLQPAGGGETAGSIGFSNRSDKWPPTRRLLLFRPPGCIIGLAALTQPFYDYWHLLLNKGVGSMTSARFAESPAAMVSNPRSHDQVKYLFLS